MIDNPWPALVYALLVAAFLLLPYVPRWKIWPLRAESEDLWLAVPMVVGGGLLAFLHGWELAECSVLLLLSAFGWKWRVLAGAAAAALLFLPATWWMGAFEYSLKHRIAIAAVCLVLALLALLARFATRSESKPALGRRAELALVAGLLLLGIGAGLLTGAVNERMSAWETWHHWGAYISPVSALLAGGVPYRDFPVQYGMGPTLLIAASCPMGCWTGLYSLTVAANALELAAMGWSLLLLTRKLDTPSRLLALAALVCAVYIWSGYPTNWGSPIMTPSVAGMRFLPLVLLLALILTAELGKAAASAPGGKLPRGLGMAGHGLWIMGLAWSPECAFFASLLWWPYLALRRADAAQAGDAGHPAWHSLLRGAAIGMAALVAGYAGLALLFRLFFGDWVRLGDFLLYMQHPPGAWPVNAKGAIWFVAAILLLAARALCRQKQSPAWRSLYACVLVALASLSYYLSRSHDNNLLNLLPFLLPVLIATRELLPTQFVTGFVRAGLAAVIAFTASIHYHPWTVYPGASTFAGLQVGSAALTRRFAPTGKLPFAMIPAEAAAAFDDLHGLGARSILLFDGNIVMPMEDPAASWTPVNNLANFIPLPDDVILRYIRRGAEVYHRDGWIVLYRKDYSRWLDLFQTAYGITEERRYGSYSAYHLVPRNIP